MKNKLLTFFLTAIVCMASSYLFAGKSGKCGPNLTWTLTDEGVLTISGTGGMDKYYQEWDSDKNIKTVIISDGVTYIGQGAFRGCSNLTSVTIGKDVEMFDNFVFDYCDNLTTVTINSNYVMSSNYTLNAEFGVQVKKYIIGNGVTNIGNYAFENCSNLISVTIPNSVTSIGEYAFENCSSLPSVVIPNSVTSIGISAFEGCSSLTSITIPNSVTSIGNSAFYNCSSLTSATIGSSVTSIGESAFSGCSSLTSITIPSSVTSIGNSAFYNCSSLTSITIPNSVTSIGQGAFWGSSLTSITCEAVAPPTLENIVFDGVDKSIPLYVPAQSIDLYKAADGWKDFTNILPIPDVEPQKYTITWQDEDGNVIKTDQVAQGTTPAFTGTTPTKPATNEYTYEFAGWLPKIQPASKDMYYTTFFERNKIETPVYTVNINGENCSLNINNQYPEGTVITLEAVADECFEFQQWSDGNKDNPRSVTVTKDMSLTAEFNKVRYTVTGEPSTGGKVQIRKQ